MCSGGLLFFRRFRSKAHLDVGYSKQHNQSKRRQNPLKRETHNTVFRVYRIGLPFDVMRVCVSVGNYWRSADGLQWLQVN